MAKESMKAREVKRAKLVAKYAEKKKQLKAEGNYEALQLLPKNASRVRLHNRCKITGRPKGYIRQFGISRIQFREMASAGLIPGVKKASWYLFLVLNIVRRIRINLNKFLYDRSNSRLSDKIEKRHQSSSQSC